MEVLISVENFEENGGNYREINSPRSLEACLRSGLDPSELYPRLKKSFREKSLSAEMIDIKYNAFENKRRDKIELIKRERTAIITFANKKLSPTRVMTPVAPTHNSTKAEPLEKTDAQKTAAMIELEEKRIEALKRRQEKELSKIVEREQTMAQLQAKLTRAEEEELKKRRAHEKKVADEKIADEKKRQQRELELKKLEEEEMERKKELARRDAEVEEKIRKKRLQMEQQMRREARERDMERRQKIEEARKKTEDLIKQQEELAEYNRLKMIEREERIIAQLEQKKLQKKEEMTQQREKASKRIAEAIDKHHTIHIKKKEEFDARQDEAEKRAKENAIAYEEKLRQQADSRDKRNNIRLQRLIDSFNNRKEHRDEILDHRSQKEQVYLKVKEEQDNKIKMMKFYTDLKMKDKMENVERVARVNEFKRLQTLQKIYMEDNKLEDIKRQQEEMLQRHREEAKMTLCRKHEITDTMEQMRMTNDFTLLDKLFLAKKKNRSKKTGKFDEPEPATTEDNRLNQTV